MDRTLHTSVCNVLFQKVVPIEELSFLQKKLYISLKEIIVHKNMFLKLDRDVLNEHQEIILLLPSRIKPDSKYEEHEEQAIHNLMASVTDNIKRSSRYDRTFSLSNTQLELETLGGEEIDRKLQTGSIENIICMVVPLKSEFECIAKNYKQKILSTEHTKKNLPFITLQYFGRLIIQVWLIFITSLQHFC